MGGWKAPGPEPVIFQGVCAEISNLSPSLHSRAWLGYLVIGEEAHTPGFLTGSLTRSRPRLANAPSPGPP